MNRSARRELAFKLLYSLEVQKELNEETINLFLENNSISENNVKDYVSDVVNGINNNKENIDKLISANLKKDWEIDRISKIDLALLKLAVYEISCKKIPFKVVINEVVELAKKYGEEQSPSFINGVLANIVKEN